MESTMINATAEFMQDQLKKKDERIQQLEEHVQRITQRDYSTAATLTKMRDGMHEWTMAELESEDITKEQAEAIADICGFELTKEVEVEVTVQYSVTVNLGPNEDVQDIIHDIDFDTVSYNDDKITWLSSSIDSIDY